MKQPDWLLILEAQLASAPRGNNGTTSPGSLTPVYAFSTVAEGAPKVRHVVHRAATPSALLLATTDIRSAKATQLVANPAAEAAWWFPGTNVQFRVSGRAFVLPATSEENERSASRPRSRRSSSVHSVPAIPPTLSVSESEPTEASKSVEALALTLDTTVIDDKESPLSPHTHLPSHRSPLSGEVSSSTVTTPSSTTTTTTTTTLSRASSLSHPQPLPLAQSTLVRSASQRTNRTRTPAPCLEDSLRELRSHVPPTAPESSPSWWTAERKRLWEGMNPAMRASFARPKPGKNLDYKEDDPETWPKTLGKHAADDEESRTLAFALSNFALLALAPERVEVLELAVEPHRRTVWNRTPGTAIVWEKEDIVP